MQHDLIFVMKILSYELLSYKVALRAAFLRSDLLPKLKKKSIKNLSEKLIFGNEIIGSE